MIASIKRTIRRSFFLIFLAVFSVIFSGCAYTTGSLLPSHLKTIYVDNFKNKINIDREVTEGSRYALYRPGLENEVTSEVVDRFVFDGNLRIEDKKNADLILTGSVVAYRQDALRYDSNDNVEEYYVRIIVDIEATDTADDKVLWKESGFAGESTYKTTGRFAASEDSAREEAIEDLARRIVERTVECW